MPKICWETQHDARGWKEMGLQGRQRDPKVLMFLRGGKGQVGRNGYHRKTELQLLCFSLGQGQGVWHGKSTEKLVWGREQGALRWDGEMLVQGKTVG